MAKSLAALSKYAWVANTPRFVKVVEVSARDGLQNEKAILTVEERAAYIDTLSEANFKSIEIGSFISPKRLPQMANTKQVWRTIKRREGVEYVSLVPNARGAEDAIEAKIKDIAIFASATQAFSHKNIQLSIDQSLKVYCHVLSLAKLHHIRVRGYVSMVLGCPFQGAVEPEDVFNVTCQLLQMGCHQVSLGDTIGRGTPETTQRLMETFKGRIDPQLLAAHFHDTSGMAVENILVALQYGIRTVDCSIGGVGGCPYSRSPVGNVETMKVVKALHALGYETGLDEEKMEESKKWMIDKLLQKKKEVEDKCNEIDPLK